MRWLFLHINTIWLRRWLSVGLFLICSQSFALTEWSWHRTSDGAHPNAREQQLMWLMNRARQDPIAEGQWLAESTQIDVGLGRIQWSVSREKLVAAFAAIPPRPPAAFDSRLYRAALRHSLDLREQDAQGHDGQLEKVWESGFDYRTWRGNVYSYADSALNAHAAFNIDWGLGPHGMQNPPGHRIAIMSADDGGYSNVGISVIRDRDPRTVVGDWIVTGNYAKAIVNNIDHFNRFVTGTVWSDKNNNGVYDIGEGLKDVLVYPSRGEFYAVTSVGGGYAFPITSYGETFVSFSGGSVTPSQKRIVLTRRSVLLDLVLHNETEGQVEAGTGSEDAFLRLGVRDLQKFGNGYGTQVVKQLNVEFVGTRSDLILSADGYDIDNRNELRVFLNGQSIGGMHSGPDNGLKTSEFSIPALKQISGINRIEFRPTDINSTWGVRGMRLRDVTGPAIMMQADVQDTIDHGYGVGTDSHVTVLRRHLITDGSSKLRIRAHGFHAISDKAIRVYFNGKELGYLKRGASRRVAEATFFKIPAIDTVKGTNQLEFHFQRKPGSLWGVSRVKAQVTPAYD